MENSFATREWSKTEKLSKTDAVFKMMHMENSLAWLIECFVEHDACGLIYVRKAVHKTKESLPQKDLDLVKMLTTKQREKNTILSQKDLHLLW